MVFGGLCNIWGSQGPLCATGESSLWYLGGLCGASGSQGPLCATGGLSLWYLGVSMVSGGPRGCSVLPEFPLYGIWGVLGVVYGAEGLSWGQALLCVCVGGWSLSIALRGSRAPVYIPPPYDPVPHVNGGDNDDDT